MNGARATVRGGVLVAVPWRDVLWEATENSGGGRSRVDPPQNCLASLKNTSSKKTYTSWWNWIIAKNGRRQTSPIPNEGTKLKVRPNPQKTPATLAGKIYKMLSD